MKLTALFLALVLMLSALAGCSQSGIETKTDSETKAEEAT